MTVAPHRHGLREGTAAAWTAANPILGVGEEGRETDTGKRKVGDGLTHWNDLAYDSTGGSGSGVSSFNSRTGAVTLTKADVTGTGLAAADVSAQPSDADLTAIAALDSATAGVLATDGSGWIRKTYAQLKTALSLTKSDVGLGSADNTADAAKNVLSATKLTTARTIDGQSFDGTANVTVVAPGTHAATSKATPVDADELPLVDSAASNVLKRLTWANVKATLKTYFDGLYAALTHSHAESDVTSLTTDLAAKAPLASPTFTGTPAAPTAAQGTNTTQLATTAYVQTEAGLLVPKSLVDAKGDLLVGTADNTVARLAAGANGTVPTYDSSQTAGLVAKFPTRSVSHTSTDTTAVNTTSETVVASQAIPTTVAAGDVLRLVAFGDLLNNSGSNVSYTLKAIIGATTVLTSGAASIAASATRHQWKVTLEVLVVATNDERLSGNLYVGGAVAANWPISAGTVQWAAGRGTATEDLTAGKNLQLSVTMGTAAATADFVCHESWLEVVKR